MVKMRLHWSTNPDRTSQHPARELGMFCRVEKYSWGGWDDWELRRRAQTATQQHTEQHDNIPVKLQYGRQKGMGIWGSPQ